jgi:hypothetical protein
MRQKGSILVVVLGLLAILAVIGVAFLTLSSLERTTAASFALQTQMTLAADGAIEYAVHEMVLDVWEWEIYETHKFRFTGKLLTGRQAGVDPIDGKTYPEACEAYDFRQASTASTIEDLWLSRPITSSTSPTGATVLSFGYQSAKRFGIQFGRDAPAATWPDNLGFPVATPPQNGLWTHELAAPCDQYLVRASVTVLDHNALVNLNAHGNRDTGGIDWVYDDCRDKGYFVSDVQPAVTLTSLLFGKGTPGTPDWVPGCWGEDNKPGNPKAGAVLIENPSAGADVPYTLDEEFELRNLWGTYFTSRLEQIWPDLLSDPTTAGGYTQRLKTTTVSWTAEVRGDGKDTPHATMKDTAGADLGWSAAKADLNTATANDIYQALRDGRVMEDGDDLRQLVANIVAFRRRQTANNYSIQWDVGGKSCVGAARQPIFTEATCTADPDNPDDTDPNDIKRTYTVKVEVYNPWPGDYDGDPDGKLKTAFIKTTFEVDAPHEVLPSPSLDLIPNTQLASGQCAEIIERQVVCHNNLTLSQVLKSILLHYKDKGGHGGKTLNLDMIGGDSAPGELNALEQGCIARKVFVDYDEPRGTSKDPLKDSPIPVLYVSNWNSSTPNPGSVSSDSGLKNTAIPIRFLNCVDDGASGLPVRGPALSNFKAFAHVGDLNQVLRFHAGGTTWWAEPWICTVTRTARTQENTVKFDWTQDIANLSVQDATAAAYAANVLSVGGPWNDGLDNDGDGIPDFADNGTGDGRTGGPEFRVAGKINLNTAITETLSALKLAGLPAKPIKSPAQVLTGATMTVAGLEVRDLPFTLISNIATVRSDTFSIYGTVQIVDPSAAQKSGGLLQDPADIKRTRRFWALVDRSPSLAYPPDNANFIRPRILNFQWLD